MILITIHLLPKENSHLEDISVCNSFSSHFMVQFYFWPAFHCFPGDGEEGETDRNTDRDTKRMTERDRDRLSQTPHKGFG